MRRVGQVAASSAAPGFFREYILNAMCRTYDRRSLISAGMRAKLMTASEWRVQSRVQSASDSGIVSQCSRFRRLRHRGHHFEDCQETKSQETA